MVYVCAKAVDYLFLLHPDLPRTREGALDAFCTEVAGCPRVFAQFTPEIPRQYPYGFSSTPLALQGNGGRTPVRSARTDDGL